MQKIIFSVLLLCFSFHSFAQTMEFAVGEWAPYTGKFEPQNGVASNVVRAALKSQGVELKIKFYPWARAKELVKTGKVVASFPWFVTEDNKKEFDFSLPFTTSQELFFYKKDNGPFVFTKMSDLKNYKIGKRQI